MLTPQEVQEKTFGKAVFGGYDMQAVDEFLDVVTKDYGELHKENAVLKNKLRVLVKALETMKEEQGSRAAEQDAAQKTCDAMIRETQEKCDAMLRDAEHRAGDKLVAEEQKRLELAKTAAQNYIAVLEQDIRGHLELLESLKTRDMAQELPPEPFDFEKQEPSRAEEYASAIDESLTRMGVTEPEQTQDAPAAEEPAAEPSHPDSATRRFEGLQFGRNYDPKNPEN
ncbi:MAG: DivIVA domain-containing protein [Oscillospiraceae bacterium]|nr:DivIVA domain-containing protein [Oscillospiraceae bacterium]